MNPFNLKNKKIFIGGGYGLLGSSVVNICNSLGAKIVVIEKVENILEYNKTLQFISNKFKRTLSREFSEQLKTLSNKLELWYDLTFEEFILELKKKKIIFKIGEDSDLENYFIKEQQKALEMKSKINQTDKEIDQMVYELYGLTKEEIEIVENS